MENISTEIITATNNGLADMTDDIVASAEKRIAQIDKIINLSIRRTNENDWVDQNGKPYLTASGAEKIARLFGISWKILRSEKIMSNDEKGQFYFYQITGTFMLAGGRDSIEAVGTCSSKDQFFAKVKGVMKPLSEIDETNIMKAAYSNTIANGVCRLLGIRNLTWEQVRQGGIDQNKAAKIEYAAGGAGGGCISDAQAKRFFAIAKSNNKTEDDMRKFLKEKFNIDKTIDIKKENYEEICAWAAKKGDA